MIEAKCKNGVCVDIVVPGKKSSDDISDIVPDCESLTDDLTGIVTRIQGDRRIAAAGVVPYTITSGRCLSRNNAIKLFWLDYERKCPIKPGGIYWRTKPVMHEFSDRADHDFQLTCRFSIA